MSDVPDAGSTRQSVRKQLEELDAPHLDDLVEAYFKRGPSTLAQAVFLHAAWREVIPPNDAGWNDLERQLLQEGSEGSAGAALTRMLALGATREDISKVVRHMQRETLLGLCGIIDNTPGLFDDPVNKKLHWHLSLFEKCPSESSDLGGLHELVEEFDPASGD